MDEVLLTVLLTGNTVRYNDYANAVPNLQVANKKIKFYISV